MPIKSYGPRSESGLLRDISAFAGIYVLSVADPILPGDVEVSFPECERLEFDGHIESEIIVSLRLYRSPGESLRTIDGNLKVVY